MTGPVAVGEDRGLGTTLRHQRGIDVVDGDALVSAGFGQHGPPGSNDTAAPAQFDRIIGLPFQNLSERLVGAGV